jgi:uncharacterized RDD family membrane protein YckC
MNWYYAEGNRQVGPVTETEFQNLVNNGTIKAETLVWREGLANWVPYREISSPSGTTPAPALPDAAAVAGTAPAASSTGTVVCAECHQTFPVSETIQYGTVAVCANCKPVFVQKLREGATTTPTFRYAGFWIRFVAKFLDGLILAVPFLILFFLVLFPAIRAGGQPGIGTQIFMQLIYWVMGAIYNIFFLGKFGATPGKMAVKIKVITADGTPVSYLRATGRYFAEILSGLICYIGYIIAGFDSEKRALHDHICSTRVIKTG